MERTGSFAHRITPPAVFGLNNCQICLSISIGYISNNHWVGRWRLDTLRVRVDIGGRRVAESTCASDASTASPSRCIILVRAPSTRPTRRYQPISSHGRPCSPLYGTKQATTRSSDPFLSPSTATRSICERSTSG